MATTRCKVKVWKKEACLRHDGEPSGYMIQLGPVYDGSEENKAFFEATPSINIHLGVVNPSGAAVFEEGMEMYVDFTPAQKETPKD